MGKRLAFFAVAALELAVVLAILSPAPAKASGITLVANHRMRLVDGVRVHEDELPVGSGNWFAIAHAASATPVEVDVADDPHAQITATVSAGNTGIMIVENTSTSAGAFSSDQTDTFEANQNHTALGHTISIGVVCNLVGGTTEFRWILATGTANNIHFHEYSGAADADCLDGTNVTGSNASETFPFTSASLTLTGGGIVVCTLVSTAATAITTGTERSNSNGNTFEVASGERASSGACTWSGTTGQGQLHLLIGIEEAGGAAATKNPAHINSPGRGSGLRSVGAR